MKGFFNKTALSLAVAGALLVACPPAPAASTFLAPGTGVIPGVPIAGGTILADTGFVAFSYGAIPTTGSVREFVGLDTNPASPFGAGHLDFVYQITLTGGELNRMTDTNFASWLTYVGQDVGPDDAGGMMGTTAATNATRSADGSTVGWNFTDAFGVATLTAGKTSYVLYIQTNATSFQPGTINLIDGGVHSTPGYAPGPEPASIVLFGTFLGMAGCRAAYRRFKGRVVA